MLRVWFSELNWMVVVGAVTSSRMVSWPARVRAATFGVTAMSYRVGTTFFGSRPGAVAKLKTAGAVDCARVGDDVDAVARAKLNRLIRIAGPLLENRDDILFLSNMNR